MDDSQEGRAGKAKQYETYYMDDINSIRSFMNSRSEYPIPLTDTIRKLLIQRIG